MRFVLGRSPNGLALLVEFRSQESFDGQCLQAICVQRLAFPFEEGLEPDARLDLCLRCVDPPLERWYPIRILESDGGTTIVEVLSKPLSTPRTGVKIQSVGGEDHQTTRVLPVPLLCKVIREQSRILLMVRLGSITSFTRVEQTLAHLNAFIARTGEEIPLNSTVDVCLEGNTGERLWYEGRIVNRSRLGLAVETNEPRPDVEQTWSEQLRA